MTYKQLTLQKRYQIWVLLQQGCTQKEIADTLGVHPSTISRELRRNRDKDLQEYRYQSAEHYVRERHRTKPKYSVITIEMERYIREKLKAGWSPEQIAGRMKYENIGKISHESIYQYTYRNKANQGRL